MLLLFCYYKCTCFLVSNREAAMAIVNDENWIDVLKNKSWEQSHVTTPLRKLIIKLPCTSNLNLIQIFKQGVNKLQKNAFFICVQFGSGFSNLLMFFLWAPAAALWSVNRWNVRLTCSAEEILTFVILWMLTLLIVVYEEFCSFVEIFWFGVCKEDKWWRVDKYQRYL